MKTDNPAIYGATITVDNVNEALPLGLNLLKEQGKLHTSRGLQTLEFPGPVHTIYRTPSRRVLFDKHRDANPFFHLIEALWIMSGSRTVSLPCRFLERIKDFSDDGESFHGAYGHRLRHWSTVRGSVDQLQAVVKLLHAKPDTRQAVLSIWDPALDLGATTKDMPCNDLVFCSIRDGALHITVSNRSNDAIWGAYGANAVQFSMIQEWLACALGVEVGKYVQMSNSFHIYTDNAFWKQFCEGQHAAGHISNPYMAAEVQPVALASSKNDAWRFLEDCETLNHRAEMGLSLTHMVARSPFFQHTVVPMMVGYDLYKQRRWLECVKQLETLGATDWALACTAWAMRRADKAMSKAVH